MQDGNGLGNLVEVERPPYLPIEHEEEWTGPFGTATVTIRQIKGLNSTPTAVAVEVAPCTGHFAVDTGGMRRSYRGAIDGATVAVRRQKEGGIRQLVVGVGGSDRWVIQWAGRDDFPFAKEIRTLPGRQLVAWIDGRRAKVAEALRPIDFTFALLVANVSHDIPDLRPRRKVARQALGDFVAEVLGESALWILGFLLFTGLVALGRALM